MEIRLPRAPHGHRLARVARVQHGALTTSWWLGTAEHSAVGMDCSTVTVYFVEDIVSASGCAYPGTNWVTVDAGCDGTVVVQEIGHLADLWRHSDDPDNVMTDQTGGTHDQITENQCCMIRTSRFVRFEPACGLIGLRAKPLHERLEFFVGGPFKRKDRS